MDRVSVTVVIVTFNRKLQLAKLLNALQESTVKPENIVLIDNASQDGTSEYLESRYEERKKIDPVDDLSEKVASALCWIGTEKEPSIHYYQLAENIGGAGGFSLGQQIALSDKTEFIWLMDDDGQPTAECLEELVSYLRGHPDVGILNPLVVDIAAPELLAFGLPGGIKSVQNAFDASERQFLNDMANPFNGTLIRTKVVNAIGLVKAELFIWGDETEYMERAKLNKIEFGTYVAAKFWHPKSKTSYQKRFFNVFTIEKKPLHLEMNVYRNQGYLVKKYGSIWSFRKIFKRIIISLLSMKWFEAYMIAIYYIDGYTERFKLPNIRK